MNKKHSDNSFYDAVIDWEKRLKGEIPFFEKIFQAFSCQKILDCACGPGHHAAALSQKGFNVFASDRSREMICAARKNAREKNVVIPFYTCSFSNLQPSLPNDFDAVFCIGNSFSLAGSLSLIRQAFREIKKVLKPGGIFAFQVLNYQRIFQKKIEWVPVREISFQGKQVLVMKRFWAKGRTVHVHWINVIKDHLAWQVQEKESTLIPVMPAWATATLVKTGFSNIRTYGNYQMEKLTKESKDLIIVCRKDR